MILVYSYTSKGKKVIPLFWVEQGHGALGKQLIAYDEYKNSRERENVVCFRLSLSDSLSAAWQTILCNPLFIRAPLAMEYVCYSKFNISRNPIFPRWVLTNILCSLSKTNLHTQSIGMKTLSIQNNCNCRGYIPNDERNYCIRTASFV